MSAVKRANRLVLEQRHRLFVWCEKNREEDGTYTDLAARATNELGFVVSVDTLTDHWVVVNGPRVTRQAPDVERRVLAAERRLDAIEQRLNAVGA